MSGFNFLVEHPRVFEKPFKDMRIAFITTASKGATNLEYMDRARLHLAQEQFNYSEIDLDEAGGNELKTVLKGCDAVLVAGGNSFYLLKSIRQSGFEKVIKELLSEGLIYMGVSAGSYVACPTIETATWKHQDKYEHFGVTDFTAMNLVPFLMSVHYRPEYRGLLKEKISQTQYEVKVLTDRQAILIIDDIPKLIGEGDEVRL